MSESTASTKEALLSTAEQLFAERGVATVSLRQIQIVAGQRNESALHYHFGSREGLLAAVLRRHSAGVEEHREKMIRSLEIEDPITPTSLVEAYVVPYASLLDRDQSSRYYLRIRAHIFSDPTVSIAELHRIEGSQLGHPDLRLQHMASRAFPEIPGEVLQDRITISQLQLMQALAFRASTIDSDPSDVTSISNAVYTANLIDMYCGAVGYPLSPRLRSALALEALNSDVGAQTA